MKDHQPKRREAPEIASDILKAAGRGERKTRVMYGSALNSGQLKSYTEALIRQGLLAYDPGQRLYFTTDKGRQFVKFFDRFAETRDLLVEQSRALHSLFLVQEKRSFAPPERLV